MTWNFDVATMVQTFAGGFAFGFALRMGVRAVFRLLAAWYD